MAYWWVSQNQTYEHERAGEFLWAPVADSAGQTPHHWATMTQVQPGDVIFSYVNQAIKAISIAKSVAVQSLRPIEFSNQELWKQDGFRIDAEYRDIEPPLQLSQVVSQLQPLLPSRYSPLTRNGTGVQGYLFGIPPAAGQLLLNRIDAELQKVGNATVDSQIETGIRSAKLDQTTKKALVDCRVGQGLFRDDLIKYWKGRCAITGADLIPLLRASHIKPWRDSNNFERLDAFNGLLLTPNYDAAFDKGLISFNESGDIILSKMLTPSNAQILGLIAAARLSRIDPKHLPYLLHHRSSVFEKNPFWFR
jgi:putative restriction endonuclease